MNWFSNVFQAAELLRHPHLQPYVAEYGNVSPVFLPVKSEAESKRRASNKDNKLIRKGHIKASSDNDTPEEEKNSKTSTDARIETVISKSSGPRSSFSDDASKADEKDDRMEHKDVNEKETPKLNLGRVANSFLAWKCNGKIVKGRGLGEEKAEAMESLLEVCAQLLKGDRMEELAGVLKPFGEEEASSRETAIWLAKGLMNMQSPKT